MNKELPSVSLIFIDSIHPERRLAQLSVKINGEDIGLRERCDNGDEPFAVASLFKILAIALEHKFITPEVDRLRKLTLDNEYAQYRAFRR